ncbi:hypothetical protein FPV67DRAFT_1450021 [Lyophyllum atratum]|nr:hypothetical protein FPV67DRAFT_1450021 [Lyophyllum atratum]
MRRSSHLRPRCLIIEEHHHLRSRDRKCQQSIPAGIISDDGGLMGALPPLLVGVDMVHIGVSRGLVILFTGHLFLVLGILPEKAKWSYRKLWGRWYVVDKLSIVVESAPLVGQWRQLMTASPVKGVWGAWSCPLHATTTLTRESQRVKTVLKIE